MGALSTLQAYRALSPQQKKLLKTKRIEGDYSPDYWLRLLDGLAAFDTGSDRLRNISGILFFVALVPVGIGTAFLPLLPFGLLLMAGSGALWLVTRRVDLRNHLRLFVMPLLNLLGDDIKRGRTLKMRLDLRGSTVKDKFTEKLPTYKQGAYHKVVESHFEDPWLDWEAVLADGAHLQLHMHDSVRQLKRTKRTARGKTKTKTKIKLRSRIEVQIKLPVDRFRARQLDSGRRGRQRMKIQDGEKWLSIRARQVVNGGELGEPALEPVLDLITHIYQGVEALPATETGHA